MELIIGEEKIAYVDGKKALVGEVAFPQVDGVIQITHTFVDEAYRGQGIAGKLLDALVAELRKRGEKALPVCTYSVSYFAKHPEALDVVRR